MISVEYIAYVTDLLIFPTWTPCNTITQEPLGPWHRFGSANRQRWVCSVSPWLRPSAA